MLSFTASIKNGKLHFEGEESKKFKNFIDTTPEEVEFIISIEDIGKPKTLMQLNKVHKMIREIAKESGVQFEDVKKEIKRRCGFENDSFKDMSIEDLNACIEICKDIYKLLGIRYDEV